MDLSSYGTAKVLHFLQYCAWSDNVPTGVRVGQITVYYQDGSSSNLNLMVGVNTAEWSYDNPKMQEYLQHRKVPPAISIVKPGWSYPSHWFHVSVALHARGLLSVKLTLDPDSYTNQQYHGWGAADWFGITINALTLEYAEQKPKDPKKAVVGHWQLDEKKGSSARDSSGNGHDGIAYGSGAWQPNAGAVHGALGLDGVDDYVDLPIGSLISQLTNCTIMTWVNWSGEHSWQRIFDFGSGTEVNMFLTPMSGYGTASGEPYELRFAITTGGGGAEERISATPLPGGWHHVAVTINADAQVGTLYVDGAPVAAKTGLTLTPGNLGITSQNWLGRSQYSSDSYFQGSLDDFRIYDQALSQGEIQAVMAEAN
jgi:hypothetical protein